MAVIDRVQLLADTKLYLPSSNILSDMELNLIIDNVVDFKITADDEIHYSEALCKTLKAAALLNRAKATVDESGIKREKVGGIELEKYHVSAAASWSDYIDSLSDICPYLPGGGYTPSRTIGIKINPSEPFKINDCPVVLEDSF